MPDPQPWEQVTFRVGDVWSDRVGQRRLRVVTVPQTRGAKVGVRNVATGRLSYLRPWAFQRLDCVSQAKPFTDQAEIARLRQALAELYAAVIARMATGGDEADTETWAANLDRLLRACRAAAALLHSAATAHETKE